VRLTRSVRRSPERLTMESWEWLRSPIQSLLAGSQRRSQPRHADVVELEALGV